MKGEFFLGEGFFFGVGVFDAVVASLNGGSAYIIGLDA
jgi:hypothetical protein